VDDLTQADVVFEIGVPPARIDILTSITAVTFDDAWPRRLMARVAPELDVPFLGRDDLITNKRAAGRPKDLGDVAWLTSKE
jgi:hypothetical protein